MKVDLFNIEGLQFIKRGGVNPFLQSWFEKKLFREIMMARAIGLRKISTKFDGSGREAGDGGDLPFLKGRGISGSWAGGRRWPVEFDLDIRT